MNSPGNAAGNAIDALWLLLAQFLQMFLVLGLAPLLTGLVRKVKARLQRDRKSVV